MNKISLKSPLVIVIYPFLLLVLIGFLLLIYAGYQFYQFNFVKWQFAGFSSPQTFDPIFQKRFKNEERCVQFGQEWIVKQKDISPTFVCATNCYQEKQITQIGSYIGGCLYVCRYNKKGLDGCDSYPPYAGS